MMLKNYFVFDGVSSLDYNVGLSGTGVYNAPRRDYESIEVPGRNGNLTLDNGRWNNYKMQYTAVIGRRFPANVGGLRAFLLSRKGYCRLEDTYHPDEFRMAIYSGPFEIEELGFLNRWGQFPLEFDCKPQRFLKSGEQKIIIPAGETVRLYNPTHFDAKPMIRLNATGSVTVGNTTLTANNLTNFIDFDCDLQDAREGLTNRNGDVTVPSWPVLSPGETGILNSTQADVEVIPRWWRL